jgi:hypothetical protein
LIDAKARKKIIKLWEEGESKASIQKQTGVTQPTIRKVLRKAGLDRKSSDKKSGSDDSDLEDRVEQIEEQLEELKHTHTPDSNDQMDKHPQSAATKTLYPIDRFIVNLKRNWPYAQNTPLQCLYNGVATWELPRLLRLIYSENITNQILHQIPEDDPRHIYEVTLEHRGNGKEVAYVEMLDN